MKKLIIIADWAGDALISQEIRSTIEGYLKNPKEISVSFVPSTPSSIHTAYLLSQIAETEERYGRPLETIIYQHTDTRIDAATSREDTKGADFFIIRLKTGLYLCGPNAQYNYSFIRQKIHKAYQYNDIDTHTQFRARDAYARITAHLMDAMEDELDLEEVHTNLIPALQGHYIGHIDTHGNIKTTISKDELKGRYEYEQHIPIKINNIKKHAKYVSHLFTGSPGELVIYPGSSGRKDEPFLDISIWQHFTESHPCTSAQEFGFPRPGTKIEIQLT